MKKTLFIVGLFVFIGTLQAEPNRDSYARVMTKFGGSYSVGDTFSLENFGCGLTSMKYKFFDPMTPGGWYYGLVGADFKQTIGGVMVGDFRPVTLGWRKEIVGSLGLDLSLTSVIGSRIIEGDAAKNFYLGVRPSAGAYIAIGSNLDLEVAYEPMITALNLCGTSSRQNMYHDISLYLVVKKFSLTRILPWK